MNAFIGDWHALVVLLVAGVIPNQIWRMLGLLLYPLFALMNSGLDILFSGVVAGTLAYGLHRVRARA